MTTAGHGSYYLDRSNAVQTYEDARRRTHRLNPKNWRHYLELARKHGLPSQPQALWPDEWEAGGRYSGYLGTLTGEIEERGLLSAMEIRKLLGIGYKAWKILSEDLPPDGAMSHKEYYDRDRVRDHLAANIDRLKKADARENLRAGLANL